MTTSMLKAPNKSYSKESYPSHKSCMCECASVHVCTPLHAYMSVCSNVSSCSLWGIQIYMNQT